MAIAKTNKSEINVEASVKADVTTEAFKSTDPNMLIAEYIKNYSFNEEAELRKEVQKLKNKQTITIDYTLYPDPDAVIKAEIVPSIFTVARSSQDRVYIERLQEFFKAGFVIVEQGNKFVPSGAVKIGADPTKRTVYLKTPSKHLQSDEQLEEIAKDKLAPIAEAHKKQYFNQDVVAKWLEQTISDNEKYNTALRNKQIQAATAEALSQIQ